MRNFSVETFLVDFFFFIFIIIFCLKKLIFRRYQECLSNTIIQSNRKTSQNEIADCLTRQTEMKLVKNVNPEIVLLYLFVFFNFINVFLILDFNIN